MSAVLHDVAVGLVGIGGVLSLVSVIRADMAHRARGRRLHRAWRRG